MEAVLIQPLSVEDLKTLVASIISDQLKEHLKKDEKPKQYISRREAAKILDCSLNTLDDWTLKKHVEAYKFGSTVKYLKNEVEEAGPNIIRRRKNGIRYA